ncbi:MAG: hypothetical protein Q9216_002662 [Gyalolechia sp. 2 TL-2023]
MLLKSATTWLAVFGYAQSLPTTSSQPSRDTDSDRELMPSDGAIFKGSHSPLNASLLPLSAPPPAPFLYNYRSTEYFLNFTQFAGPVDIQEGRGILIDANEYILARMQDRSDPFRNKFCGGAFRWARLPLAYTILMKPATLCISLGFFTDAMLAFEERFGYFEAEVVFLMYVFNTASFYPLGAGHFVLEVPRAASKHGEE